MAWHEAARCHYRERKKGEKKNLWKAAKKTAEPVEPNCSFMMRRRRGPPGAAGLEAQDTATAAGDWQTWRLLITHSALTLIRHLQLCGPAPQMSSHPGRPGACQRGVMTREPERRSRQGGGGRRGNPLLGI